MQILVLGGGFAGVEAVIKLRKYGYEVTLISDRDYLFIYPVSIWIPVGKRSFEDSKLNLSALSKKHGFKVIIDRITSIDAKSNLVIGTKQSYTFDFLFIALGMGKLQMDGISNTYSICGKPEESVKIYNLLDALLKKENGTINIGFGGNPKDPKGLTVRGGPAFELLFNISTYLKEKKLSKYFQLVFFAPMAEPGKRMGEKAMLKMGGFFKHYKVTTHFGKKIKTFTENSIVFEDNTSIPSDLTLFISGGEGLTFIKESDLPTNETGFIQIDPYCRVLGYENIYAIGDAAALEELPWAAKQGHIAEIMADISVYNFHQIQQGKISLKSYIEKLSIICVMDTGDGAAFVFRSSKKEMMIPLPIIGHWMKKGWGWYFKNSKMKRMFRIPGM